VGIGVGGGGQGAAPRLSELGSYFEDPRLFEPFRPYFHPTDGRPSVQMETYVRMMALKYRYQLGYEALCEEVSDSVSWRLFCRIAIGERVPHPSTGAVLFEGNAYAAAGITFSW